MVFAPFFALIRLRRVFGLPTVPTIQQRCYQGVGIGPLVFVGRQKNRFGDVPLQYNNLDPITRLVEVPCNDVDGEYTLAHFTYDPKVVESWLVTIDRPPRVICMDNSYEPGFKHMVEINRSSTSATVIYTGMDHSKTDSSPKALFRTYDLCMTYSLTGFSDMHAEAVSREEDTWKGQARQRDVKFVVLVNKKKGWRIWFIARLHEYGILQSTLYTLAERPHPCSYYSKKYDINNRRCTEENQVGDAALHFSRSVDPRALSGERTLNRKAVLSEFDVKAMIPRGRVHVILESEPTSLTGGSNICLWNERVTEKTWNVISFGHPFILVGTFLSLDLVRAHGFKTFSPCINETYGVVWDADMKMQAALDEVRRLHALSDEEYDHLYETCLRPIAQYNYELFHSVEYKQKQAHQRLWAWGIADTPGFDMVDFRAKCDDAVLRRNNLSLAQCRN